MRDALERLEPLNILAAPSETIGLKPFLEAAGDPDGTELFWDALCQLVGTPAAAFPRLLARKFHMSPWRQPVPICPWVALQASGRS